MSTILEKIEYVEDYLSQVLDEQDIEKQLSTDGVQYILDHKGKHWLYNYFSDSLQIVVTLQYDDGDNMICTGFMDSNRVVEFQLNQPNNEQSELAMRNGRFFYNKLNSNLSTDTINEMLFELRLSCPTLKPIEFDNIEYNLVILYVLNKTYMKYATPKCRYILRASWNPKIDRMLSLVETIRYIYESK